MKRQLADIPNKQIHLYKYEVLEDDLIHGFDLQKVKKYMRIDGTFEDDVLELMLIASIREVEQLNNVSLTGKLIGATFMAYGELCQNDFIEFLPFPPICEIQSYDYLYSNYHIVYETKKSEDPRWFVEVCNMMLRNYENRGKEQSKRVYYL